jgi:hypothetical protein
MEVEHGSSACERKRQGKKSRARGCIFWLSERHMRQRIKSRREDGGKTGIEMVQFWLTRKAGQAGDPSLRLKNGFAQDDNHDEDLEI